MKANDIQAFPLAGDQLVTQWGMTLRDYFAAKAMQAMVTSEYAGDYSPDKWAEYSYDMADAMLKKRELQ